MNELRKINKENKIKENIKCDKENKMRRRLINGGIK